MLVARRLGGTATVDTPSIRMSPPSGVSKPAMRRRAVDLPQPDGPRRQTNSPSATSSDKRSMAATAPKLRDTAWRESVATASSSDAKAGGEGAAVEHAAGDDQQ